MSGVCGFLTFDGSPVEGAVIGGMLSALHQRGPDAQRAWSEGPVALGHTLLATTSEALVEKLPLTHSETGCTITADARLDNREELFEALGIHASGRTIGDGELILAAYLKWGPTCVEHLLGDFVFALWDPRSRMLFGARDPVGMRQLIYTFRSGDCFAFASDERSILAHSAIGAPTNECRLADCIEGFEDIDLTSTFYEGLFRLPPAHLFVLRDGELLLRQYWELSPVPECHTRSPAEWEEELLDVLSTSVRARLRSAVPPAAMLSGGLDSTTVAALASAILAETTQAPLKTISVLRMDNSSCPETQMIEVAAAMPNLSSRLIYLEDLNREFPELFEMGLRCDNPFDGHMNMIRAIYRAAKEMGANVVLDGVGADTVLGCEDPVTRNLRRFNLSAAYSEMRKEAIFWGQEEDSFLNMAALALRMNLPRPARKAARRARRLLEADKWLTPRYLDPDFARSVDFRARAARYVDSVHPILEPRMARAFALVHPSIRVGRERYDRVAASLAIEPRDPFLDVRLLKFLQTAPCQLMHADGWPKLLLRNATNGVLPDRLRWRIGKEHLGGLSTWEVMWKNCRGQDDIVQKLDALTPYVTQPVLNQVRQQVRSGNRIAHEADMVYTSFWLTNCSSRD